MSHTSFEGGIGYEGKVTLTLKNNNRVLKSKTYKNKGMAPLFNFLGHCLAGSYEDVKNLVPTSIRLLFNTSNSPESADPTSVSARTITQEYIQTPTVLNDSSSAEVKVTYSFEVSNAAIGGVYSNENGWERKFNQIALYSPRHADDITEFSAYHYLKDNDGKFDTINAEEWSATTILLIEWELTLSNKNIETNN